MEHYKRYYQLVDLTEQNVWSADFVVEKYFTSIPFMNKNKLLETQSLSKTIL